VVDEADLIFSFGHDGDMKKLMEGGYLPKVFQSFLMSATMTKDVQLLRGLVLRDPVRKSSSGIGFYTKTFPRYS
jgi:ATP-dependent RNA helicase DDX56/DBP9